jgi:hypothetical protein
MTGLDDLEIPYTISNDKDTQRVLSLLIEEAGKIQHVEDLRTAQAIAVEVVTELTRLRSALNY